MAKMRIAFVCTHNACRSQIAEAFARHLAGDVFESWSAGTTPKDRIDPGAVRIVKEQYGIDMEAEGQYPKTLDEVPELDGIVTMGCGVQCPYVPSKWREDWGLVDPTGQEDSVYLSVMEKIRSKVLELKERMGQ